MPADLATDLRSTLIPLRELLGKSSTIDVVGGYLAYCVRRAGDATVSPIAAVARGAVLLARAARHSTEQQQTVHEQIVNPCHEGFSENRALVRRCVEIRCAVNPNLYRTTMGLDETLSSNLTCADVCGSLCLWPSF